MEYWWCCKPDCCGAQAVRRRRQRRGEKRASLFAALKDKYEGLSVMKDSLFTGAVCIAEERGGRPGRDVIAERRKLASRAKAVESLDFFEDASANQLQKGAVTVG